MTNSYLEMNKTKPWLGNWKTRLFSAYLGILFTRALLEKHNGSSVFVEVLVPDEVSVLADLSVQEDLSAHEDLLALRLVESELQLPSLEICLANRQLLAACLLLSILDGKVTIEDLFIWQFMFEMNKRLIRTSNSSKYSFAWLDLWQIFESLIKKSFRISDRILPLNLITYSDIIVLNYR